uniref:Putative LAGLIDADG homing endonuclease n=1 Tax=Jenufa perforata TaxID=993091 RepID=A0A0S2LNB4_9CHLO|nr:putative LAGLIDADG homing endonuclease [Jenufa perforata]ALO62929.1 putative LAGLIDADG homing endonuclease [Jenufa perforata]
MTYYLNNSNKKKNFQETSWNEWLAGLIDANGCLLISPKGYTSLEITMGISDELALLQIKKLLGGSVKLRSGARAVRYRLHHKEGMEILLSKINGYCRNSIRVLQLQKLCVKMQLDYIFPVELTIESGWFAGFFDGDGTIGYSFKKDRPQLIISVSNKKQIDCLPFKEKFGGFVRLDRRCNVYKWDLYEKNQILFFCNYLKKYPLYSHKKNRLFLVSEFYELTSLSLYKQPKNTLMYKTWQKFEQKWFS